MPDYTIRTPDGEFSADSLKGAQKLARQAARASKKEESIRQADSKLAHSRAESAAYRLYSLALRQEGPPRGIRLVRAEHFSTPVQDGIVYETEQGRARYEHHGYTVVGIVEDSAGFALATVTRDNGSGEESFLAVGVAGKSISFADMPGLDPALFERSESSDPLADAV